MHATSEDRGPVAPTPTISVHISPTDPVHRVDLVDSLTRQRDVRVVVEDAGLSGTRARGPAQLHTWANAFLPSSTVGRMLESASRRGVGRLDARRRSVGRCSFGRAVAAVANSPFDLDPGAPGRRQDARATSLVVDGGPTATDPSIVVFERVHESPFPLARHYFAIGRDHSGLSELMASPPSAAAALLVPTAVLALARRRRFAAVPLAHLVLAAGTAARLGREPGVAPHRVVLVTVLQGWSLSAGVLARLVGPRGRRSS